MKLFIYFLASYGVIAIATKILMHIFCKKYHYIERGSHYIIWGIPGINVIFMLLIIIDLGEDYIKKLLR